ncbi:TlpA disulfide reductase family protein [Marixanthomonas ophiurae]|uniref:AhpC/TSA family protein n=1 Tax=Marixanthomonas ophiurae TaxID=387659 RepID=A0A3E1Q748_9FLAO|nr:TlpA disulfide reductase family protein [Marixanthomonas ophiurae]RFN57956.1 AhpC/TSA family protein [Marixanthomonas ophiurae]
MRRILFTLLTAILLTSCAGDSNTYTLKGTASNFKDSTDIYVYSIKNSNQPKVIDTLTIMDGKFEGTYPKSDSLSVNYLTVNGVRANIVYFPENVDMKATLYKDSIGSSFVTGGKQNEAFKSFSEEMRGINEKKQADIEEFRKAQASGDAATVKRIQEENLALTKQETELKKDFIKSNKNSLFSVMLLSEMITRKEMTAQEASEVIDNLSPKVAASPIVKQVEAMIKNAKKVDIGSAAPDFSGPTPEGETLALKDALGKYTIIDFWASWCKPCRVENPNVVKVYEKYHDKGLNIISVSLDRKGQKDKWIKAIADDNMDWHHISNLQFWQDPIARAYNVRAIPATFLLDENGKIIDKNLRGAALGTKMESLLGNEDTN